MGSDYKPFHGKYVAVHAASVTGIMTMKGWLNKETSNYLYLGDEPKGVDIIVTKKDVTYVETLMVKVTTEKLPTNA